MAYRSVPFAPLLWMDAVSEAASIEVSPMAPSSSRIISDLEDRVSVQSKPDVVGAPLSQAAKASCEINRSHRFL